MSERMDPHDGWTPQPQEQVQPGDPRYPMTEETLKRLICALCLYVGDSEEPEPITILNGQLTCEPHAGYFQGDEYVQAVVAWKREHKDDPEVPDA